MKFTIIENEGQQKSDYEVRFVIDENLENCPDKDQLVFCGFKKGSVCDLPGVRRVYVSIKDTNPETIRIAISKVLGAISGHKIKTIKMPRISAPASGAGGTASAISEIDAALCAIAEGFTLGAYSFDAYKSDSTPCSIEEVLVSVSGIDKDSAVAALERGRIVSEATNFVRDIVNEIPEVYTPERMARDAEKLAEAYFSVTCEVHGKDYLKNENMNAFLAVNQSGPNEPRLIHLTYKPKAEAAKKICFVGKGLTYDSGGLSLKPTSSMQTMKADKSGAAAAMGIIKAAAELELPFEVHSVLGATENMIGSAAYKPDDVIRTRGGVTVEVTNTDAEGRLVLCDCLSWAQDHVQPDYLLDMATLTGACVVGLGDYTSGVIGNNYDLQMEFKKAAEKSGENYTILEFNDHLRELLKSKVADIPNAIVGAMGGALTAGLFLDRFIKDEYKDKWLHLDIAGPAFVGDAWGYNPAGGSGAGVRGPVYWMLSK